VVRERRKPRGANNLWANGKDSILVGNRPPFTERKKKHVIFARTNQPGVFDAAVGVIRMFKFKQGSLLAKETHGSHLL
jgi:hypothetical protein